MVSKGKSPLRSKCLGCCDAMDGHILCEMFHSPQEQEQTRGFWWGLMPMAEEEQGGGGWEGRSGQRLLGPSCLWSSCRASACSPAVNGNLLMVSMAAGKINADGVPQEGEETLMAPGLMCSHLISPTWGLNHPSPPAALLPSQQHTGVLA